MRDLHYRNKRATFQTPWEYAPRERIGQPFEIVGVDMSDERMVEGGGGPLFDIRFPDGLECQATEEEAFEGVGWEP